MWSWSSQLSDLALAQIEDEEALKAVLGIDAWNQMMMEKTIETANDASATTVNLADPVKWIEENFWVPELKGPVILQRYQRRMIREALRRDASGNFVYTTIVWGDIKKSIKSTIAAAVMTWRAWSVPYGQCVCVANDLRQANTRVLFYTKRAFQLNPHWKHIRPVQYKINLPNQSYIEAVAIDPTGEAGGNPDFVVFSELWGAHQEAQKKMWTEMTIPPTKFGLGIRWVETYAGYSGESPTLERLYETGMAGHRLFEGEYFKVTSGGKSELQVWANEPARLLMLWNQEPRCPWQTPEYYAQQAADLTETEFDRVHRNRWVSSEEKFVPDEWWHSCLGPVTLTDKSTKVVVAMDAAVSNDCFGIIAVKRSPTDPVNKVELVYARKWDPKLLGHKIDYDEPEAELKRLCALYNVVQVCYDEFQLHNMATRLRREMLAWFFQFNQGKPRTVADKQLYDLIRDRKFIHNGDPDLTKHIQNSNRRNEGEKMRIVKRADTMKIDLAVSASMAAEECLRLNLA